MDFAVELGVADLFEQRGEMRAGREAVSNQVGAVDQRQRIEPLGGPGQALAAEREGRIVGAGDTLRGTRAVQRRRRELAVVAARAREVVGAFCTTFEFGCSQLARSISLLV